MEEHTFAEVRSLMNQPHIEEAQWDELRPLLHQLRREHPDVYQEEYLPYLRGFSHHFEAHFRAHPLRVPLLGRVDDLLRVYPVVYIQHFEVVRRAKDLYALLDNPQYKAVHSLQLHLNYMKLSGKLLETLARSPNTVNLAQLSMSVDADKRQMNERTSQRLAALLELPRLEELTLLRCAPKSLEAFAASEALAKLRSLSLIDVIDGVDKVLPLLSSPHIQQLRSLSLVNEVSLYFGPPLIHALMESEPLQGLESLSVINKTRYIQRGIDDETLAQFATSGSMPSLRSLYLGGHTIGDAGAVALAQSSTWSSLEILYLKNNRIGPEGVLALARSPHLRSLQECALAENALSAEHVRDLLRHEEIQGALREALMRLV